MTDLDVAEEAISIVLRGQFNPAIISPAWFLAAGLVGKDDATEATPEIMASRVSVFDLPWARVEVTDDRFLVQTLDVQQFERCRDLAVGTFASLSHTPVNALGINRSMHVRLHDEASWHGMGDAFLPKEIWDGPLTMPGVRSVLVEGVRPDSYGGRIMVRFEPSNKYEWAVYLEYNDHYDLRTDVVQPATRHDAANAEPGALQPDAGLLPVALDVLTDGWADINKRAVTALHELARRGTGA